MKKQWTEKNTTQGNLKTQFCQQKLPKICRLLFLFVSVSFFFMKSIVNVCRAHSEMPDGDRKGSFQRGIQQLSCFGSSRVLHIICLHNIFPGNVVEKLWKLCKCWKIVKMIINDYFSQFTFSGKKPLNCANIVKMRRNANWIDEEVWYFKV